MLKIRNSISLLMLMLVLPAGAQLQTPRVEKLKTEKIKLGKKIITVEIADTEETRARGLMFRKSMGVDEGMLFVFAREMPLSFWMKNTFIPLSIGFFDSKKELINVLEMEPEKSETVQNYKFYPSERNAQYALEMNKNWFKKNKIRPGTRFDFVSSELKEAKSKK